jgi:hypothetical protein
VSIPVSSLSSAVAARVACVGGARQRRSAEAEPIPDRVDSAGSSSLSHDVGGDVGREANVWGWASWRRDGRATLER